jgi:site-specific DNA-methyltransferase (adenine-specific)
MKVTDKITITQEDNMLLMARYPDNYFDLAIVDPPYGLGISNYETLGNKNIVAKNSFLKKPIKPKLYKKSEWDNSIPNKEYFKELKRISKKQIIWGVNYFDGFGLNGGRLFWDKQGTGNYSRGEIAYLSFVNRVEYFNYRWCGMLQEKMGQEKEERYHPTQKPVNLYKWLLDKYAKENDKILDTHLGSGSIAIACHDYGFELTACELDKEYFDKAIQRINNHVAQQKLF